MEVFSGGNKHYATRNGGDERSASMAVLVGPIWRARKLNTQNGTRLAKYLYFTLFWYVIPSSED